MAVVVREEEPVIHHVHDTSDGDSGIGFFIGILFIAALLFLFVYYLLPVMRNSLSGPSINVPSQFDVNIHNK